MSSNSFETILSKIPEIAKAVNEFKDSELQKKAFDALMQAAGLVGNHQPLQPPSEPENIQTTKSKAGRESKKGRVGAAAKRWSGDKYEVMDVDLHPEGKSSLKDFYNEKAPKIDPEKYISIIYYLTSYAGVSEVRVDHIYTAFKQLGLKVPDIRKGLNNTRGRKAWVEFKRNGPISLTRIGENIVEHDLPRQGTRNDNG